LLPTLDCTYAICVTDLQKRSAVAQRLRDRPSVEGIVSYVVTKNHTFTLCSKNELESHRSELKSVSNICLVHRHFRSVSGLRTKNRPADNDTGETL